MRKIIKLLPIATMAAIAACATPATGPESTARFDNFMLADGGTMDFTGYDRVYIAPVAVSDEVTDRIGYRPRGMSDRTRPLTEREIESKVEDLEMLLRQQVGGSAQLVDSPAPGVLSVVVTLTGLDANRPTQGELSANPGLSFNSRYQGGGSAEIAFYDGDRLLATATDADVGTRNIDELTGSTWQEADQFFRRFSSKVAGLLG